MRTIFGLYDQLSASEERLLRGIGSLGTRLLRINGDYFLEEH
jgi:hypothetical protein